MFLMVYTVSLDFSVCIARQVDTFGQKLFYLEDRTEKASWWLNKSDQVAFYFVVVTFRHEKELKVIMGMTKRRFACTSM